MTSPFDSARFNERLFFPRTDESPCPPGARDERVKMKDGTKLHARHYLHQGADLTVMAFHGNGEVIADWDDLAPSFHALGASLVVYDYRGYGRSEGTPTLRQTLEDAVRLVRATVTPPHTRVVYGRSLGALSAIEIAARKPAMVDAVVLESGGSSLETLLRRRGMEGEISEEDRAAFDPLPRLAKVKLPALVLHGAKDRIISPEEARVAWEALASEQKKFALVQDAGHEDMLLREGTWQALSRFVASLAVRKPEPKEEVAGAVKKKKRS